MSLTTGTRLGSYEIIALLGEGGMGAVYRARDTKLGRDVAIKVVLEAFVADRDRLARFEREARSLAALNHPNVATLYGKEEIEGRHFLVMELVDGLTLAGKLAAGPLPLEQTLRIAMQIAEGLEAAHEKGIVHRDLKPANIKITPDEKVKVLDFGLATAGAVPGGAGFSPPGAGPAEAGPSFSLANSPTLTAIGTQAGMILGTASYMSPEQARGMAADHRSDVFSFGVVLFEMLTGRQPFPGDTVSDVLASVLARDPDLSSLPPDLAPRLSDLVKRCLDKHPRKRWQAIGDVRHELELIAANPRKVAEIQSTTGSAIASAPKPFWRRALPFVATAVLTAGVAIAATTWTRPAPAAPQVARFTIRYGEGEQRTSTVRPGLAISPDGLRIAYLANRQIRVREIGALESRALVTAAVSQGVGVGTPTSLAFSPQGTSIAYYETSDQTIKQIALAGGPPTTACALPEMPNGLSWYGDFIYVTSTAGIQRCAALGGPIETVLNKNVDDAATRPQLLPDGRLLFSLSKPTVATTDRWTDAEVVVQRPGDAAPKVLFKGGNDPRYLPSGHIVYISDGILYARTFDPKRTSVGGAVPMVEGIFRTTGGVGGGTWWYSVSDTGTLVYQPGVVGASSAARNTLASYDRTGKEDRLKIPPGPYSDPRVSPDGTLLAYSVDDGRDLSIWVAGMDGTPSPRRLTFGGRDRFPAWSFDSKQVIFQSDREGDLSLFVQPADNSRSAVRLTTAGKDAAHVPLSVSPEGAVLLFDETRNNRSSLMTYSFKDKTTTPYAGITSIMPTGATFSPNGRWVAYAARAEGQQQSSMFVQPYPATGAKYPISPTVEDGHHAVWSRDGKELFYTPGPGTVFVPLSVNTSAPVFTYGPAPAFPRSFVNLPPSSERPFDVWKNAKGEPVIVGFSLGGLDTENRVVLNWFEELKARVK